jgi:hypothetical protein
MVGTLVVVVLLLPLSARCHVLPPVIVPPVTVVVPPVALLPFAIVLPPRAACRPADPCRCRAARRHHRAACRPATPCRRCAARQRCCAA